LLRVPCVEACIAQRTRRATFGLRLGRARFYGARLPESRRAGETYRHAGPRHPSLFLPGGNLQIMVSPLAVRLPDYPVRKGVGVKSHTYSQGKCRLTRSLSTGLEGRGFIGRGKTPQRDKHPGARCATPPESGGELFKTLPSSGEEGRRAERRGGAAHATKGRRDGDKGVVLIMTALSSSSAACKAPPFRQPAKGFEAGENSGLNRRRKLGALINLWKESSLQLVCGTANMSTKMRQGARTPKSIKMKVDPEELLKTKRGISDIMSHADELLKINKLAFWPMSC